MLMLATRQKVCEIDPQKELSNEVGKIRPLSCSYQRVSITNPQPPSKIRHSGYSWQLAKPTANWYEQLWRLEQIWSPERLCLVAVIYNYLPSENQHSSVLQPRSRKSSSISHSICWRRLRLWASAQVIHCVFCRLFVPNLFRRTQIVESNLSISKLLHE